MSLSSYITLGRSGLRVSPLALGTMTFGTVWGWGSEENVSREIFNLYIDAGGNFIDTADQYTGGNSEEMTGKFISDRQLRIASYSRRSLPSTTIPEIRMAVAMAARTSTARSKALCGVLRQTLLTSIGCTPGTKSLRSKR